jgi:hypothetical protein
MGLNNVGRMYQKNGLIGPVVKIHNSHEDFIYIYFLSRFCKIYDPPKILQKYTSAVVAHAVRDITARPTVVGAASSGPLMWDRHSVVPHDVKGPSAVGYDVMS